MVKGESDGYMDAKKLEGDKNTLADSNKAKSFMALLDNFEADSLCEFCFIVKPTRA